jgi:hypothetical protein
LVVSRLQTRRHLVLDSYNFTLIGYSRERSRQERLLCCFRPIRKQQSSNVVLVFRCEIWKIKRKLGFVWLINNNSFTRKEESALFFFFFFFLDVAHPERGDQRLCACRTPLKTVLFYFEHVRSSLFFFIYIYIYILYYPAELMSKRRMTSSRSACLETVLRIKFQMNFGFLKILQK